MERLNSNKKANDISAVQSLFISNESFEIVVIEDKKLSNMIFGKTLQSAIERICNLKKFPIKFSSFQTQVDFINYLENKEFGKLNVIVFSDNNLDKDLNSDDLLFRLNQKGIDLKMIVMSENSASQSSDNIFMNKVQDLIPNKKIIPTISSKIVEKMVI